MNPFFGNRFAPKKIWNKKEMPANHYINEDELEGMICLSQSINTLKNV
jgi:hypothetical protein